MTALKRFPRRAGLAMGLAAVAGITTLAGAGVAQAQVPPCTEYAQIIQVTSTGQPTGAGIISRNPGEMVISNGAPQTRNVQMTGVHRPRRPMVFQYRDENGAVVRQHQTRNSDDGGVVRQEQEQIAYDFTQPGQRIQVFADIRTRCGGDDVPATVFVGTIVTTS